MPDIEVTHTGNHEYEVRVAGGGRGTRHRVRVPAGLRDDLGLGEADEPRLLRASFEFLLEREPASAILSEFDLDVISDYFPEYPTEIRARLA